MNEIERSTKKDKWYHSNIELYSAWRMSYHACSLYPWLTERKVTHLTAQTDSCCIKSLRDACICICISYQGHVFYCIKSSIPGITWTIFECTSLFQLASSSLCFLLFCLFLLIVVYFFARSFKLNTSFFSTCKLFVFIWKFSSGIRFRGKFSKTRILGKRSWTLAFSHLNSRKVVFWELGKKLR